jgi:small subunit ribosomal protein S19e
MANVYEVNASELVRETAKKLKGVIKQQPNYLYYAKSGANRERQPQDPDFWYVRNASLLRYVYTSGPAGVSRLRSRYGSRKEHTMHRKHHVRAGGSVIQDSLNALELANLVKKTRKGREITPQGKSFLDKISNEIAKK